MAPRASAAEHETRVVPTGNGVPDGAHDTVTGKTPPPEVGGDTWTDTGAPVVDCPRTLAGHVRVSGDTAGGDGAVGGSSPHETAAIARSAAARRPASGRRPCPNIRNLPPKTTDHTDRLRAAKDAAAVQRTANS